MALARSMTSGLRRSGTKGPKTAVPRPAANSSAAFFCSGVIFSGGISGMRSCAAAMETKAKSMNSDSSSGMAFMAQPRLERYMPRLLFLLPLPDLEDVATSGVGGEFAGTWLAGRGEADLVTVRLQFVDTEHNLFLGRDGIHVFRPF